MVEKGQANGVNLSIFCKHKQTFEHFYLHIKEFEKTIWYKIYYDLPLNS